MTDFELFSRRLDRRGFLGAGVAGATSLALAACTTTDVVTPPAVAETPATPGLGDPATMYAARVDEGYNLPAIPFDRVDPKFYRQVVDNPTGEAPGTIVVDTSQHFLYLVQPGGKAIRYGVSLGKAGFGWTGSAVVQWKKKWPTWTPPAGDDPAQAGTGQICRGHAARAAEPARRALHVPVPRRPGYDVPAARHA